MINQTDELPRSDHHTVTLSSGSVVHIWRIPEPRAVVILQHGFGEYAERYVDNYHQLIPTLNGHGFEIRALDMQGHGRSTGIHGLTDINTAVAEHVQVRQGASINKCPIFLFGHSLGGLVTVGSVTADPSNIRGVILTGPALPSPRPAILRSVLGMAAKLRPNVSMPFKLQPVEGLSQIVEKQKLFEEDKMIHNRQLPILLVSTALETTQKVHDKLKSWTTPILLIHGKDDLYTNPAESKEFIDGLEVQDKTLILYENGRHETLNDVDQDDALGKILQWLEQHLN